MRSLLPLNSLRAFEAAARHTNFADAADELGVTPAAVSQHIQKLEAIIGASLFARTTRSVVLTDRARQILPLVSEGFESLDLAMKELMTTRQKNVVTISATPSFASCWLLPRLEQFRQAHPDITVHVDARSDHVDFQRDGVDLSVRQGTGKYAGLTSELLIPDRAFVVCHPRLLESGSQPLEPEDLNRHTLLHVDWKMQARAAPTWQRWAELHSIEGLNFEGGMRFSMEEHAVKAAVAGMGFALATQAFISDDLQARRLVRALPGTYDMPTVFHHYLVSPKSEGERRSVRKIRDWLRSEAALFNDASSDEREGDIG